MNSNTNTFSRTATAKLGTHRDRPRVYLQGLYLARAGFEPGCHLHVTFGRKRVTLHLDDEGERKVSGKQKGRIPVIDLNTKQLKRALGRAESLTVRVSDAKIVIEPSRVSKKVLTRCKNGKSGTLFCGGGTVSAAARDAGYDVAWGVEWDERYAELFQSNYPDAHVFNQSVHEVDLDELEPVELLTAGVPCEPYSRKRRTNRGAVPEDHAHGDMTFWTLRIIDALNPRTVLIENVAHYLTSASGIVMQSALKRLGYRVEARVFDARDYGDLAGRERAVIIATSDDSFVFPEPDEADERCLGDVLEEVPEDSDEWFDESSKSWLFKHWAKQSAKGNRFASCQLDATSRRLPCISKRYFNGQGDGCVVKHPSREGTFRWLRVTEVARAMGLPEGYNLGGTKTVAGNVLGQGVAVGAFTRVLRATR
jgi:DNA (cytosine-5)-methyltransferase 1